jgi:hypothetical protein
MQVVVVVEYTQQAGRPVLAELAAEGPVAATAEQQLLEQLI